MSAFAYEQSERLREMQTISTLPAVLPEEFLCRGAGGAFGKFSMARTGDMTASWSSQSIDDKLFRQHLYWGQGAAVRYCRPVAAGIIRIRIR